MSSLTCSFDLERQWDLPFIAGVDEVGRGCLAGPVVAAAVIFDSEVRLRSEVQSESENLFLEINDSKKVKPLKREKLSDFIKTNALAWAVAEVEPAEIDRINILQASLKAMRLAVEDLFQKLGKSVDLVLVDGNQKIPTLRFRQQTVIGGDSRSRTIAAASILAKVYRDQKILELAQAYPDYGFESHKGYGTELHRRAIQQHGITPLHRLSFLKKIQKIDWGQEGEDLACRFLEENEFQILERRWRQTLGEIDIVAEKEGRLHFVEVRRRSGEDVSSDMALSPQKIEKLKKLVELYQIKNPKWRQSPLSLDFLWVRGDQVEPFWNIL